MKSIVVFIVVALVSIWLALELIRLIVWLLERADRYIESRKKKING